MTTQKILETRFYQSQKSELIYQVNFVKVEYEDGGNFDMVEIKEPRGEWAETYREWIDKYYPEVHQDIIDDPVEGWSW